jgi:septum formation protein
VENNFLEPQQTSYPLLEGRTFVLGSQSPRRKALLEGIGIAPVVKTNDMDETIPAHISAHEAPEYLAREKATFFIPSLQKNEILVTADTVVIINKQVLGKPANREEAIATLALLSGQMHEVVSGVCISSQNKQHSFSETTKVFFRTLSLEQISFYIDQFAPYDKAGGYGIQEWIGLVAIEKIEGDFYNVMGLPVGKLVAELQIHFPKELTQ